MGIVREALAVICQRLATSADWKDGLPNLSRLDQVPLNTKFITYLALIADSTITLRAYVGMALLVRNRLSDLAGYPVPIASQLEKKEECRYPLTTLKQEDVEATEGLSDHVGANLPLVARSFFLLCFPSESPSLVYVATAIEEVICRYIDRNYKGMLLNTQKGKYWASEKVMTLWWVVPRQLLAAGVVTLSSDKSLDALVPADPDPSYLCRTFQSGALTVRNSKRPQLKDSKVDKEAELKARLHLNEALRKELTETNIKYGMLPQYKVLVPPPTADVIGVGTWGTDLTSVEMEVRGLRGGNDSELLERVGIACLYGVAPGLWRAGLDTFVEHGLKVLTPLGLRKPWAN
jgi:hypothetical protein